MLKSGRFCGLVASSLRVALRQRLIRLIVFAALTPFLISIMQAATLDSVTNGISLNIARIFWGDIRVNEYDNYVIPISWLCVNAYIAFLVGGLPFGKSQKDEELFLLASADRRVWWLSKCVVTPAVTLVAYAIIYFWAVVLSISNGVQITPLGEQDIMILTSPIFASFAFSFLQSAINLFCKPVFGFLAVEMIQISSTYIVSPYILGHYSQIYRQSLNGFGDYPMEIVYSLSVIAVCVVFGVIMSMRKDFIPSVGENDD